MGLFTI